MADTEPVTDTKLSLPTFLRVLTSNGVPAAKAMAVTGKVYKLYNTPSSLADLTDFKLKAAGVDDKEDRKLTMNAIRKAGYKPAPTKKQSAVSRNTSADPSSASTSTTFDASVSAWKASPFDTKQERYPSSCSQPKQITSKTDSGADTTPVRRKRKRVEDRNEFLPDRPPDELEEQAYGSLEFNEVLDEEVLKPKFVVVNRAPIMTAWSFIVAERLGFNRQEALSIASVYTEMNAISKGVAIGVYPEGKQKGVEATKGGSQPYVDLMSRRPLYQTAKSSWRALSSGSPVSPASAFSYITRSLRQQTAPIIGALRLLAQTYTPEELNKHGFALYAEFRPEVNEWGGRGEVRCQKILSLRKGETAGLVLGRGQHAMKTGDESSENTSALEVVKFEAEDNDKIEETTHNSHEDVDESTPQKKVKTMTLEEYEAALDADDTFANIDLDKITAGLET